MWPLNVPKTGHAPLKIQFIDKSSGNINHWLWDFGDGMTSTDNSPRHTYLRPGTYTVTLTVIGVSCSATKIEKDYVSVLTGATQLTGITREVNGDILSGVSITLDGGETVVSDLSGHYQIMASTTGSHTLVAHKDGFRDRTRTVNIVQGTATCSFQGQSGLIPNAPNIGYALACINHWLYPPGPDTGLDIQTVLAVINAWLYPIQ